MTITLDFDIDKKTLPILQRQMLKAMAKVGIFGQKAVKQLTPIDNGGLANSNFYDFDMNEAIIYNTKEYAPYVEFGTDPHKIEAKNKEFLTFKIGGRWVKKKSVQHPGTKRQPFMRLGIYGNRNKIKNIIRKTLKEVTG